MKLGARMFKTGLVVVLAFYISQLLGLNSGFLAAIASVLAIKPSILGTFKHFKNQGIANIIGAVIAFGALYFFGNSPIIIGVVITLVILLSVHFKMNTGVEIAVITVIAIMGFNLQEHTSNPDMLFALNRFLSIIVGIICAVLVNATFFPPKYEKKLKSSIDSTNTKASFILKNVLNENLEKDVLKKEKKKIKEKLKETISFYELYHEENKTKIFRVKYSKLKDLVVLKNIVDCLKFEKQTLIIIDKYINQINALNEEQRQTIIDQIVSLVEYQEQIILKYEKKIKADSSFEETETVEKNNRLLLEDTVRNIKKDDSSIYIFPIISSLIEWLEQIEETEKFIGILHKKNDE